MHRGDPNSRNRSLVCGPGLKDNCIETSSAERSMNTIDVGPSGTQDTDISELYLILW